MDFKFQSKITAWDCLVSTLRHTYKSVAGVINIVFTGACIALAVRFLGTARPLEASLILLGCFWFPAIIPTATYFHHKKSLKNMPEDLFLSFDNYGMHVLVGDKKEDISWSNLSRIAIEPNMVIIYSDKTHGYMLSNKNMGKERNEFLLFLKEKGHCQS